MNQLMKHLSLYFCIVFIVSCAAGPTPEQSPAPAIVQATEALAGASTVASDEPDAPQEYGSFAEEDLYQAIISELGAQRGDIANATENYFDLAYATRDPGIIRRAVQFASASNDVNALIQLGLLWSEISPDEAEPHLMLSFQFLENGRFEQALSRMSRVLELGGRIDFAALSARTGNLDAGMRSQLIAGLSRLSERFPQEQSILFAMVQMLDQNQQSEQALEQLQTYKRHAGESASLALLEAQLLQRMDEDTRAARVLRRALRNHEEDKPLRFNYARLLIQQEEYQQAQRQFEIMIAQDPQDYETLFSVALLDLEMENYDSSADAFLRLVTANHRPDESHYYLGYIYEQQEKLPEAISHYRQVRIGTNNYLVAQQQATRFAISLGQLESAHRWLQASAEGQPRLEVIFVTVESGALIQHGYMAEAEALLNNALNKFPNDVDLLFSRVLLWDNLQDQQASEQDLRQIITLQPDDSRALNHLGYMLADQTTRYEEALELVERAIAISPDDPAIIDSLAWAQYKLGRYEQALQNLRRAFAAFPDAEVASHLGEVLWQMGRRDEANQVWEDALKDSPDSELIKNVMERLSSRS